MTKVLIDVALVAIAWIAGNSLLHSGRRFFQLFAQLRADMTIGLSTQAMQVTTRSTMVSSLLSPVPAMAYRPDRDVASNTAGALPVRPQSRRRPVGLRAAA